MLYKKYHRNFVSQFRRGIRFKLNSDVYIQTETAVTNPFIGLTLSGRHDISIETAKHTIVPLVYWSGRLMYYNVI